ncbi:MFS transporter [Nocardia sp. NPDC052566]|uniref:MFS transporter n=1 Tax=Nocardia sp. NPDC052566 TaxID=3364330 RepID=UPI0037CCB4E8
MASTISELNSGLGAYSRLLRSPGAGALALWGLIGRFPTAMRAVSCVMLILATEGSLQAAGTVAGVIVLAQGIAGPVFGRLADRRSQREIMLIVCALHGMGMGLLLAAAVFHAPLWLLICAAVCAGGTAVPVGPFARARWAALVDADKLRTAYALESILDEIVFVLGPLLVVVVVTGLHPAFGLVACAVLVIVGCAGLARHRQSEPAAGAMTGRKSDPAILIAGVQIMVMTYVAMGVHLGAIDISLISFAREQHITEVTGWLLALNALGSMVSGIWFGAVNWRMPESRLFLVTVAMLGVAAVPLALVDAPPVMALCAFLSGLPIAPTWIAGSSLLQSLAPPGSLSEGFSWLSSLAALGAAIGIAISGALADAGGSDKAAALAVGGGVIALLVVAAGYRKLGKTPTRKVLR